MKIYKAILVILGVANAICAGLNMSLEDYGWAVLNLFAIVVVIWGLARK